jgi:hypothetical protein
MMEVIMQGFFLYQLLQFHFIADFVNYQVLRCLTKKKDYVVSSLFSCNPGLIFLTALNYQSGSH